MDRLTDSQTDRKSFGGATVNQTSSQCWEAKSFYFMIARGTQISTTDRVFYGSIFKYLSCIQLTAAKSDWNFVPRQTDRQTDTHTHTHTHKHTHRQTAMAI